MIPQSYALERTPYQLPRSVKRLGIISDLHLPYHSVPALEICLNTFLAKEVDAILLNGDIIDWVLIENGLLMQNAPHWMKQRQY